jgi:hypothetical protein
VTEEGYLEHKEEINKYVEEPLQDIYRHVAAQLPGSITEKIELNINYLPFLKINGSNEPVYGILPREVENKKNSAILLLTIIEDQFIFGIVILARSSDKERFIKNCQNRSVRDIILQQTRLPKDCTLHHSRTEEFDHANLLGDWLKHLSRQNSATKTIQASLLLKPYQVLSSSKEELVTQIKETFEGSSLYFC